MVFIKHKYGAYYKEIKQLMNRRLRILDKLRYHRLKCIEQEDKINVLESEIDKFLKFANLKHS